MRRMYTLFYRVCRSSSSRSRQSQNATTPERRTICLRALRSTVRRLPSALSGIFCIILQPTPLDQGHSAGADAPLWSPLSGVATDVAGAHCRGTHGHQVFGQCSNGWCPEARVGETAGRSPVHAAVEGAAHVLRGHVHGSLELV